MPQDKDELLQVLITKYAQMYMKLAYAIGVPYDDVEDIVMEAFWSFYRADYGGKLESEKAIKVMLARIVENKCIDYFRKEKRSIKPNEDEDVSELEYVADLSTYDPLQSVISRESCGQIFEVLDGLRESWKDVTVMYFIQGFTTEEICERLEIHERHVSFANFKSKKILKRKPEKSYGPRSFVISTIVDQFHDRINCII